MHHGPRAMPALLETRGYVNSVLPATHSINRQGRAPVGLCPELPRLPGGRLQLTAAIHVRPCSPARTNTTLFQRPSWNRQEGWAGSASIPQGRRIIPQRSNWKLPTGREERRRGKSLMCARARDTTPPEWHSRGSLPPKHRCDALLSAPRLRWEDISFFLFPGWGFEFSHATSADAVQLLWVREKDLACQATSFCLQDRAWSSSGWAGPKSSSMHSLAWNVWPDLDHEGIPHHDNPSPLSANGFSSRVGALFSRWPSADAEAR